VGGTERLRIDSNGQILSTANEPTVTLKCSDTSLGADQYIGGFKFEKTDGSGAGAGVVGGMRMRSEGGVGESTYLQFSTSSSSANDTERMRITSAGNVGIGTASPQKTLDVKGTFAISNSTTSYWDFDRDDSDGSLKIADTGTERMKIDSDGVAHFNGDVKVLSGDIQMGSGRGINFSASSHFSGMTSETLDDYEEGTWTPTVSFGGASVSVVYTANTNGRYVKVGGVVHVSGCLFLSSKGSSTGDAAIGGLPFGMLNSAEGTKASATIGQLSGVSFTAYPSMLASGSALYLYDTTTGGTLAAIDNSNLTDGTSIYFTASYAAA
jgi:hypothetical protein